MQSLSSVLIITGAAFVAASLALAISQAPLGSPLFFALAAVMAAAYLAKESKLDILVNNAGAAWGAPFEEFPESGWDKVMNLNLKSPFFLTQALHGALKAAASRDQPAKVINIASIDGIRLNPQETYSYHASKSGLIYLTRRMAATLIEDSINVTAIAPGAFASEMNRVARDHGDERGTTRTEVGHDAPR